MQELEQDLKRNFCPFCLHHVNALKCENCGTEDLIPVPPQFNKMEGFVGGEALGEKEELGIGFNPRRGGISPDFVQISEISNDELYRELTEPEKYTSYPIDPNRIVDDVLLKEVREEDKIDSTIETKSPLQLDENAIQKLLHKDFGFLTGLAGTGKTTLINEVARLYPNLMEVCATTGIAAVNLGTKTIHSTLHYYDTRSLENAWREQLLHMNLRKIRARKQKLLVDEGSMFSKSQFDLIMNALDEVNMDGTGKKLGLWITGDFAQLPPIKDSYIFKSEYWNRFAENTVRLEKIWRQDNPDFIAGINLIRAGKGIPGIALLQKAGVHFTSAIDNNFEGTTLIAKNDGVDAYNMRRLAQIGGMTITVTIKKYGKQLGEWEKNIPYALNLKVGAYVMILANDIPEFKWVNGDCGIIESFDSSTETFSIRLKRNNSLVKIQRIERKNLSEHEPNVPYLNFQHYSDFQTGDWVIGKIYYHPLRLAYASTIHKSQGLSLDKVQIDTNGKMFSNDAMAYVSISRARTPTGLYLVGKPDVVGRKVQMSPEVLKYI